MLASTAVRQMVRVPRNIRSMASLHSGLSYSRTSSRSLKTLRVQSVFHRSFTASPSLYNSQTPLHDQAQTAPEDPSQPTFLSILENTISSPWLHHVPQSEVQRLELAYALLFQITLFLMRGEGAEQFMIAFGSAPAPPESEIGRARPAVATIIQATINQLSTIPPESPLRVNHTQFFATFDSLQSLYKEQPKDISTQENWAPFWSLSQPYIFQMIIQLDELGYGLKEDDFPQEESSTSSEAKK